MMRKILCASLALVAMYGCTWFGSPEAQTVSSTEDAISRCQAEGREAGSYRVYDACMADAGLR